MVVPFWVSSLSFFGSIRLKSYDVCLKVHWSSRKIDSEYLDFRGQWIKFKLWIIDLQVGIYIYIYIYPRIIVVLTKVKLLVVLLFDDNICSKNLWWLVWSVWTPWFLAIHRFPAKLDRWSLWTGLVYLLISAGPIELALLPFFFMQGSKQWPWLLKFSIR